MFSFTCQVFNIMRTAGGEVFKPLVTPLYDYINLVIDSKDCSEDEYECLNMQVSHYDNSIITRLCNIL